MPVNNSYKIYNASAGSGKTLLALAAGLAQVVESNEETRYKHLVVSRPIQPMGKDIGYLPGTMEEKMLPSANRNNVANILIFCICAALFFTDFMNMVID